MPNKNKEKADFNGKIHHVQWTNKEKRFRNAARVYIINVGIFFK